MQAAEHSSLGPVEPVVSSQSRRGVPITECYNRFGRIPVIVGKGEWLNTLAHAIIQRQRRSYCGQAPFFELAPINDINAIPRIFFIAWYIRDSQRHPDAPRLTDDQRAALALAERIANDPAFHIEMRFQPGDVQLLNNGTVLHSREEYADEDDPAQRRHLLRLWLTADTPSTHEHLRRGIPKQTAPVGASEVSCC